MFFLEIFSPIVNWKTPPLDDSETQQLTDQLCKINVVNIFWKQKLKIRNNCSFANWKAVNPFQYIVWLYIYFQSKVQVSLFWRAYTFSQNQYCLTPWWKIWFLKILVKMREIAHFEKFRISSKWTSEYTDLNLNLEFLLKWIIFDSYECSCTNAFSLYIMFT